MIFFARFRHRKMIRPVFCVLSMTLMSAPTPGQGIPRPLDLLTDGMTHRLQVQGSTAIGEAGPARPRNNPGPITPVSKAPSRKVGKRRSKRKNGNFPPSGLSVFLSTSWSLPCSSSGAFVSGVRRSTGGLCEHSAAHPGYGWFDAQTSARAAQAPCEMDIADMDVRLRDRRAYLSLCFSDLSAGTLEVDAEITRLYPSGCAALLGF